MGNKKGYIDHTGRIVIPATFDDAHPFRDGLAQIQINGKYGILGFIDHTGKMVIPAQYAAATNFNEGFASVKKNNSWQLIDRSGKPAFNREFKAATIFRRISTGNG